MADDLVADWRVQANFRFGPRDEGLLNVRADDFKELGELLAELDAGSADSIANAAAALTGRQVVANAVGPVETVSHAAAPAAGSPPTCAHGARTYRRAKPGSGKTWEAFFCPTPQNTPGQCDPIFRGDNNKTEPYWP